MKNEYTYIGPQMFGVQIEWTQIFNTMMCLTGSWVVHDTAVLSVFSPQVQLGPFYLWVQNLRIWRTADSEPLVKGPTWPPGPNGTAFWSRLRGFLRQYVASLGLRTSLRVGQSCPELVRAQTGRFGYPLVLVSMEVLRTEPLWMLRADFFSFLRAIVSGMFYFILCTTPSSGDALVLVNYCYCKTLG